MSKWSLEEINEAYQHQAFNQGYQYAKYEQRKEETEYHLHMLEFHEQDLTPVIIIDGFKYEG